RGREAACGPRERGRHDRRRLAGRQGPGAAACAARSVAERRDQREHRGRRASDRSARHRHDDAQAPGPARSVPRAEAARRPVRARRDGVHLESEAGGRARRRELPGAARARALCGHPRLFPDARAARHVPRPEPGRSRHRADTARDQPGRDALDDRGALQREPLRAEALEPPEVGRDPRRTGAHDPDRLGGDGGGKRCLTPSFRRCRCMFRVAARDSCLTRFFGRPVFGQAFPNIFSSGSDPNFRGRPPTMRGVAIHILPSQLIDQIAAGEVVERPASVVKELVENALDAGARRIDIEIEDGGCRLIRVSDDGCGIEPDELPLALSRHATSKIATLDDLEALVSMGFRGEALPSIASVSRLVLTSRTAGADSGFRIASDGGQLGDVRPAAHPRGTTVEVRDLFYTTPARRKFMRTARTEAAHVDAIVRSLALARFDVEFRLKRDRRPVLRLPAAHGRAAEEARVGELCGREFLEGARYVEHETEGLALRGWLAAPTFSRTQPDMQYTYVNGRYVRDKLLRHAARLGYQDVLYQSRHPAFVMFLALDPRRVDVNAHPAKLEIRFRDSRLVHDFVFRTVEGALARPLGNEPARGAPP